MSQCLRWTAVLLTATALALPVALPAVADAAEPGCANGSYLVADRSWVRLDEPAGQPEVVATLPAAVNAIGYAQGEGVFYGVASLDSGSSLVTITPDGKLAELAPAPAGTTGAYAGAIHDGRWYLRGTGDLHIIDVSSGSADYLKVIARVSLSRPVDLGDWDLNPADGLLYGIDATGSGSGRLTAVDPRSGEVSAVRTVDVPGIHPYGAAVINSAGTLHALRNTDGTMYHVPLASADPPGSTVIGPPARSTDSAGCPPSYDFGDAPASYGTTQTSGGPVHAVSAGDLTIGDTVDSEPDGVPSALADSDTDDGLVPPVTIAVGSVSVSVPVRNRTGAPATLACWLDLDGDGHFGPGERVQRTVAAGDATVTLTWDRGVTTSATTSFLRARLYPGAVADAMPGGLVDGGEVEDHRVRFRWPKAAQPTTAQPTTAPSGSVPPAETAEPDAPAPVTSGATTTTRTSPPPQPRETVQFAGAAPDPPDRPRPQLPTGLAVLVTVLIPAIAVAARGIAKTAARRTRR